MLNWLSKLRGENSLPQATKVLVATLFLSNVLGVIRDHFLAQKIPTATLDSYFAAFRLPDLIFNVLILGAISAAFIPVFTSLLAQKEKQRAFEVAQKLLSLGLLVVIICLVLLFFLMPYLIKFLVPDFDPAKQLLTLKLARLFLLSPLFFAVSYLFTGILNSFKHFVIASIAPLVYNLSIILATLFLAGRIGVAAPAWGVVVGAFFHMLVQLPSVWKQGWRPKIWLDWQDKQVKKIIKLMIPRSLGLGSTQIMLIGFTAIASGLGGGSVAIFNLADNIYTMPVVVFGTSVASALFPHLAESFSKGETDNFKRLIENAILMIIYFLIPISIGMILLRAQIVRIILGSGHFGWYETELTALTLGVFSAGLLFSGLFPLLAKAFYARQNTRTPTLVGVGAVIVSLALGWWLARFWGVAGLAAGVSLGTGLNVVVLFVWLIKAGLKLNWPRIIKNLIKIALASFLMAIIVQTVKYGYGNLVDLDRFVEVLGQIVVATAAGIISFIAFAQFFQIDKFQLKGYEKITKPELL